MLARPFLLVLLYNKRDRSVKSYLSVMQTMGFEPTRANAHKTLNLACLPFHHVCKINNKIIIAMIASDVKIESSEKNDEKI